MKHKENGYYNKIDVIIGGMETIGSAERSCDIDEMRHGFEKIDDGKYKKMLYNPLV